MAKTPVMLIQTLLSKIQKIVVTLKYLSNFWRLLEIPLMNCKIHLDLNFVEGCVYLMLDILQNLKC